MTPDETIAQLRADLAREKERADRAKDAFLSEESSHAITIDDNDRLKARAESAESRLAALQNVDHQLAAAIEGVIRVADRKTVEFDAARTALILHRAFTAEGQKDTNATNPPPKSS